MACSNSESQKDDRFNDDFKPFHVFVLLLHVHDNLLLTPLCAPERFLMLLLSSVRFSWPHKITLAPELVLKSGSSRPGRRPGQFANALKSSRLTVSKISNGFFFIPTLDTK
jgi:hypothetical protein